MDHTTLRVLAEYSVYFIIFLVIPLLVVIFTDRFSTQIDATGYAVLFAAVAITGILLFVPAISIVAGTALAGLAIAWLTARYALAGLTVTRRLEPVRLFPGEEAAFELRIENRKLLPVASVSLTNPIQFGLMMPNEHFESRLDFAPRLELLEDLRPAIVTRFGIGPFQSVTRRVRIRTLRRGAYRIEPGNLESGDAFGIFRHNTQIGSPIDMIVYPKLHRTDELNLRFRETLGDAVTRRWLIEDPTLIKGAREFRPGDTLRKIHWKATARTGELQVRIFDPSTTAKIMLVLNLNTFQHVWEGIDLDRMESVIELAGSFTTWALDKDFPVGLRSNGVVRGGEFNPRVPPSANPQQAALILEHLARLAFSGRFPIEEVLADESRRLSRGSSIVFVTSVLSAPVISLLTSRGLAGRVSVIYCGRYAAPVVRGLSIQLVVPPGQEALRAAS